MNAPVNLHSSLQPYIYSPLCRTTKDIRLIQLLPGPEDSDIHILLRTITLDEAVKLGFEALSYLWGSTKHSAHVVVADVQATIRITRNLDDALKHLRISKSSRIIWADAICINQKDLAERAQQVSFMATIFSRATRIMAWAGRQSYNSNKAIACIDEINDCMEFDWNAWEFRQRTCVGGGVLNDQGVFSLSVEASTALADLLNRPYFRRVWVYQELRLGRERLTLVCGKATVLWGKVRTAVVYLFQRRGPGIGDAERSFFDSKMVPIIWSLCMPGERDLLRSLDISRLLECTDDRDRVYAALSTTTELKQERPTLDFVPDYINPVPEVFMDITVSMIQRESNLNLFAYIIPSKMEGLPSWAPDWTAVYSRPRFIRTRTCLAPTKACFERQGNRLKVKGRITTHIVEARAYDLDHVDPGFLDVIQALRRVIFPSTLERIERGNQKTIESLCRVLTGNMVYAGTHIPSMFPSLNVAAELFVKHLAGQQVSSRDSELLLNKMHEYCTSRSLVRGLDGCFGLGPAEAQSGDVIAILRGCEVPILLRPTSPAQTAFKVLGPVFYDTFAKEQAILGALPSTWAGVHVFEPNDRFAYLAHRSRLTGTMPMESLTFKRDQIVKNSEHTPMNDIEPLEEEGMVELNWIDLV